MFVIARIAWSALSGGSGSARISLPLAGANDDEFSQLLTALISGVTLPSGATAVAARPRPGGSPAADLLAMGSGLTSNPAIGLTNLGSSGSIALSGIYRV